jgi:hypothetical protein
MDEKEKTFVFPPSVKPGEPLPFGKRQIPRQSGAFYA